MNETKIAVPFIASLPDSEVTAKPQRRVYAAEEKKRVHSPDKELNKLAKNRYQKISAIF